MKKTYISPSVDIYEIKVNNLLSGSPQYGDPDTTASEGSESTPANFSRTFSFGDEE